MSEDQDVQPTGETADIDLFDPPGVAPVDDILEEGPPLAGERYGHIVASIYEWIRRQELGAKFTSREVAEALSTHRGTASSVLSEFCRSDLIGANVDGYNRPIRAGRYIVYVKHQALAYGYEEFMARRAGGASVTEPPHRALALEIAALIEERLEHVRAAWLAETPTDELLAEVQRRMGKGPGR